MTDHIHIAVAGASGRMGQLIIQQVLESPYAKLTGAKVSCTSLFNGEALTTLFPQGPNDVVLTSMTEKAFKNSKVIIDFTTPETLQAHLDVALREKIALVIGTTGLSKEQFQVLEKASLTIPILYSANFSLGINLLFEMVKEASKKLGADFDVEVLEMHHRHKQDAPSGTSLMLAKAAAEGRDLSLQESAIYDRTRQRQARRENDIGFAVLRGGSVIGDHSVMFASDEEIVEFSHRALKRDIYAKGALKAALWLANQKPGYYKFSDILTTVEKSAIS
ncbi:MAG: 4-hydroxy-tetrahydrodipicolinate reductase [Candidatus Paracaedimonas acanthamoebae]|uniref:4-hydroxy-tetrahydrodipicolinate reductase n=1 Tax=Candidatus Paracaedimonas acanthamoebae TaxID=244581 RepID=A0A8J7TUJ1_9PROT|nr:4-hydroxy-tetrahydrodipicolinate reductase [Candidatus Paracaedimonas acanthamoebae]